MFVKEKLPFMRHLSVFKQQFDSKSNAVSRTKDRTLTLSMHNVANWPSIL